MPTIYLPAQNRTIAAETGAGLMEVLKRNGIYPDAPCGGNGTCGKCKVLADGAEVLACKTTIDRDITLTLPQTDDLHILQTGIYARQTMDPFYEGYLLAFDIGTTSVVCFLLDGKTGEELAGASMLNPQTAFGADVISRIQAALRGELTQLSALIRSAMEALIREVCSKAGISPGEIGVISVVGNPAMQQLFLGINPDNLSGPPFASILTEPKVISCTDILPICPDAKILIVPDIAGFVGADTMGCLLSTGLYAKDEITLLVDIGTNGEMVLGNKERMIACAAAAGPALEGANIRHGMRGTDGAIDHVRLENGEVKCSVIGGGEPRGICGSGLIDAVALGLHMGLLNKRGRIQNEEHIFRLADGVFLTQDDIRQVQSAKGAVCAGIILMAKRMGIELKNIQKVQLAGAFGSYLNPENACRIGLLPEELFGKIEMVGNAAGSGAKMLACDKKMLELTGVLAEKIEFLELASHPDFPKTFAKAMTFREEMR